MGLKPHAPSPKTGTVLQRDLTVPCLFPKETTIVFQRDLEAPPLPPTKTATAFQPDLEGAGSFAKIKAQGFFIR